MLWINLWYQLIHLVQKFQKDVFQHKIYLWKWNKSPFLFFKLIDKILWGDVSDKKNNYLKNIESNWRNLRNIATFQNWTTHAQNETVPNSNIGKLKDITVSPKKGYLFVICIVY